MEPLALPRVPTQRLSLAIRSRPQVVKKLRAAGPVR